MNTIKDILKKYNVQPGAQIGAGMEAAVFAYDEHQVLKIYARTASFDDLLTLKDFYESLDRARVPYKLPQIYSVAQEPDHIVTIEQRLAGRPMSGALPCLDKQGLDAAMQAYLSAVLDLADIRAPHSLDQIKLFDPMQLSRFVDAEWNRFLRKFLKHKVAELEPYFKKDVAGFASKFEQLNELLEQPYGGEYRLIHGDFCPGNVLMDDQHQVSALIDFGLLTMYGDHLFDMATGWVFFDMYDELKAGVCDRLLAMLLERIGADKRGAIYRYVLIYSILSANTYSADCTDGHYQWCVANLNNPLYWKHLA